MAIVLSFCATKVLSSREASHEIASDDYLILLFDVFLMIAVFLMKDVLSPWLS